MRRVFQAMIETVARSAVGHLCLEGLLQPAGRSLSTENNAFLPDIRFEIAGHIKIFIEIISALLLFGILNAAIPIGPKNSFFLFSCMKKFPDNRSTCRFLYRSHRLKVAACLHFVRVLAHAAESEERPKPKRSSRKQHQPSIANQNPVLMVYEIFSL